MKTLLGILFLLNLGLLSAQSSSGWTSDHQTDYAFVENLGQYDGRSWHSDEQIEYAYNHNPFYIFFSKSGLTYRLDKIIKNVAHKTDPYAPKRTNISELVFVRWIGANPDVKIVAENLHPNFFSFGMKDPISRETSSVDHANGYQKITYVNLYDKIDVEYTIHPEAGVKYNVILHPGADPSVIKMDYSHTTTHVQDEKVELGLNNDGALEINTSLGQILEKKPVTFYANSKKEISSVYRFENNILTFDLEDYDATQKVIIDPWIVSPTFTTSSAVWEVETDGAGNVYAIGGETPMQLKKYNSTGTLQWTYTTPWDTSTVWLGTLATDASGNSYVTSGVTAEMHKVNTSGAFVWQTALSGGLQWNSEWWSITFNCDETKLITGGTWVNGILTFDFYAGIFEIDVASGAVLSDQTVDYTSIGGFGASPVEVRSISSSRNAKYAYLTHNDVGVINQNFGSCPTVEPVFQVDNQDNLGYKCENYLPATQNGGGLKAIAANDNFIYTHAGDLLRKWNLTTGALITTVSIPGGVSTTVPLIGGTVVQNSGIDVDNCGNVYVGSKDRVIKYDPNLNILSTSMVSFNVYDVSVNANGEVLACGAQQNNQSTNRNGRIEALNMSACAQFTLVCCDANICNVDPVCQTDPAFPLIPGSTGGTWSGTGVNAGGVFDPSLSGPGTFNITYTLPCGSETIAITVNPCTTVSVCEETNGSLTASNGNGTYTWFYGTVNPATSITNEAQCIACASATPQYAGFPPFLIYTGCSISTCPGDTTWTQYATGVTTAAPPSYPIQVVDGAGATVVITSAASLVPCTTNPCTGVTITLNSTGVTQPSCYGGTNGSATVTASGGTPIYTYTWSPGSLSGGTQNALGAGTYTVTASDFNGCSGSTTVTITQPAELVASASSTPASCGNSNGTATASGTGGTGSYSYSWSPSGGNAATATNLAPGTYTVTITDQNGCTDQASTTVTNTSGPTLSLQSSNDASCNGLSNGSATVAASGGTPGYTYVWMPGSLNGATQNTLAAGSYTVTVTDGAGCTANLNVVIGQPTALTLSNSNLVDANCGASDGEATVTASGGTPTYSYSWSPAGSGTNPTNLAPGAYTVTVTDLNGCTANTSFTIGTLNGPTLSLNSSSDVSCNGANDGSASVSASGGSPGYTYTWMPGSLNGSSQSNLAGGTYTITVTDLGGCTDALIVIISEPAALTVNASNIQDANCGASNGAATITAAGGTGPYTYAWSPAGSGTNPTNLAPGAYTVTVTDQNNCSATTNFTIGTLSGPTISLDNSSDVTCFGGTDGSASMSASGGSPGYTFAWIPGGLSGATQSSLAAGTYTVTVTDLSGCTDVINVTIGEPSELLVNTVSISDANCGASDGSATVSASGGTGTYTYSWSPSGGNGATATGLAAGNYTVTVSDQNGCSATENITIGNIGGPTATLQSSTNVSCAGASDGTATVNVSGGTAPYSYAWSPTGGNAASATNLGPGNYTVTIVDGAGCISTVDVTITEPAAITLQANITDEDCGLANGAIAVQASGGTGLIVYGWSPNVGNSGTVSNLNGGSYTVTATDGNGCSTSATYTVATIGGITIDAFPETSSILQGESVILTATGALTYTWTPSNGLSCTDCASPTASPSTTTTYIVTGTDANGCTGSDTVTVYVQTVCGDLFVPNIFSPNGNGPQENEFLCVYGNCISELHYAVYNRWGELVFETTSTDICWDGNYKGQPAISGVYAYKLYAMLFDGQVVETSGNLTLVR